MRLFTGLSVPYEVRRNLELLLAHLKPTARIRWSPVENLHVTTKFIGEWPEERLDEVKNALRQVAGQGPLTVSIAGLGWFPNPKSPRIFWCGIEGGAALANLAASTESALQSIGIAKENRPYSPHLTLARIPDPTDLTALQKAISQLPSSDFGRYSTDRFHLYLSKPGPKGSIYTSLESYALAQE